jgi:hypothetical protein
MTSDEGGRGLRIARAAGPGSELPVFHLSLSLICQSYAYGAPMIVLKTLSSTSVL